MKKQVQHACMESEPVMITLMGATSFSALRIAADTGPVANACAV
jgi:hypothetical protein